MSITGPFAVPQASRRLLCPLLMLACSLMLSLALSPAPSHAQQTYPRVYGPSGGLYGPTQAHYQWQRQYGRPWHGYRGITASGPVHHHITIPAPYFPAYFGGGFCAGFGNFGWGGFATPLLVQSPLVVQTPFVAAPNLGFYAPGVAGSFGIVGANPGGFLPFPNHAWAQHPVPLSAPMQQALQQNAERWGQNLPDVPADPITRSVPPSSAAARLKSLQAQARADAKARDQLWASAYRDFKEAVDAAPDRAEAHLRFGVASVVLQNYAQAAQSFKRALHLDPKLVQTAPHLDDLFGSDHQLAQNSVISKLTDHTRADIRDPDRLFVMGVMLHMRDDDRAREFFETGLRLAGRGQHFAAFLQPAANPNAVAAAPQLPQLPQAGPQPNPPRPGIINPSAPAASSPPNRVPGLPPQPALPPAPEPADALLPPLPAPELVPAPVTSDRLDGPPLLPPAAFSNARGVQ